MTDYLFRVTSISTKGAQQIVPWRVSFISWEDHDLHKYEKDLQVESIHKSRIFLFCRCDSFHHFSAIGPSSMVEHDKNLLCTNSLSFSIIPSFESERTERTTAKKAIIVDLDDCRATTTIHVATRTKILHFNPCDFLAEFFHISRLSHV